MTMTDPTPTMDDMPMPAQPDAVQGTPFTALMLIEGYETADGRMWELGTTTWRPTPIPFTVKDTSPHGPGPDAPAWAAGQLDTIYRDPTDPSRIMARGHLMPNATGQRAEDLARHSMRGVSINGYGNSPIPPDVQPTHVDQEGDPMAVLVRYNDLVIGELTMVPIPAFVPTCLWFDDETEPQSAADAHGAVMPTNIAPDVLVNEAAFEQLVASSGGPVDPPRDWFFTPEPSEYQPMQVTADGRVSGHLAKQGQCHVAHVGKCVTAPVSHTSPPFKGFHRTVARCDDGRSIACGWIAMDTDHGDSRLRNGWSNAQVWDHYEHSGTLAAKVRASNGRHGTWLSGALLPGLSERQLSIVQGLSVSGHWHTFADPESGGRFGDELLAVLGGVPQPGFPEVRTRPELLVASGQVVGRIGTFEPCDCEEGEPMTPEEREEFDALKSEVVGLRALVAGAASTDTVPGFLAALQDEGQRTAAVAALLRSEELTEEFKQYIATMLPAASSITLAEGSATTVDSHDAITTSAPDPYLAGIQDGIESGRAHLANAIVAAVDGHDLAELEMPLTNAEFAAYYAAYSADDLAKMVKDGTAMPPSTPGGKPGYPIDNVDDLKAAIRAVGRGNGSHNAIRKHIMRQAKRLKQENLIPPDWQADGSVKSAA